MTRLFPALLLLGALTACDGLPDFADTAQPGSHAAKPVSPSTAAQASRYVLPETETLRVVRLQASALPDGRTVEQIDLGRGFMVIESLPGDAAFTAFPHDAFLPAADAVITRNGDGTLERSGDGYADGINWALYQGNTSCLFAQGAFGPETAKGRQHAARLLLCGDPNAETPPGVVKEDGLAFMRGLRIR